MAAASPRSWGIARGIDACMCTPQLLLGWKALLAGLVLQPGVPGKPGDAEHLFASSIQTPCWEGVFSNRAGQMVATTSQDVYRQGSPEQ